ncbi:hypothetical protein N7468_010191 [Penicillium chermesinum]|uniref:Reverse transcriptase domain-containing protein n=1 Tax=Penicillium chermesinum TaxID=63820 RepID=A0A9W9NC90_9EURO|nr:uncharacterized protein N7468_010191 [Penicillium chermesinum]KAJ5217183.1 hypothetical protein N7468_010191 [Penicillium chermesinum]
MARQGDRAEIDKLFDSLQADGKLKRARVAYTKRISSVCPCRSRGDRPSGAEQAGRQGYLPLPTQADIIAITQGKRYMSVFDAARCFYQWPVHPNDVGQMAVITYRGQEVFQVATMGFCNSVTYVQRAMDNILQEFREWCRVFVDDIVTAPDNLQAHVEHLHLLLQKLQEFNIYLEPTKVFIGFPYITLLGQQVDSLGMTTKVDKLQAITSLKFPRTLKQLETYLGLTGAYRHYIVPLDSEKWILMMVADVDLVYGDH